MGRIRTVKPVLFRHSMLFQLEEETGLPIRLSFIGLFTECDREGRFKWQPLELGVGVLPYDKIDFSRVLDALLSRGFLVKYEVDGVEYGCIPTWKEHQHVNNKETKSTIPQPPEIKKKFNAKSTREPREDNGNPSSFVGREGKGKEYSVAKATGDKPPEQIDFKKKIFDEGLIYLGETYDKQPGSYRSVIGKWLKEANDNAHRVFELIEHCQAHRHADPVAYISATLIERKKDAGNDFDAAFKSVRQNLSDAGFDQPTPARQRAITGSQ